MLRLERICLPLLAALLLAPSAQAIVSVEQERFKRLQPGLQGSAGVEVGQDRGNVEQDEWGAEATLRYGAPNDQEWMALASRHYASASGHKIDDTSWLHLRWYQPTASVIGYEGFVQVQSDQYLLVKQRTLVGGGLRWRLAHDPGRFSHHFGTGLFSEQETYADGVDPGSESNVRGNFYWSLFWQMDGGPELGNVYYLQPALGGGDDIRALDQLSVRWGLTDRMSLKFDFTWANDTDPIEGLEPTDTSTSLRFSYTF